MINSERTTSKQRNLKACRCAEDLSFLRSAQRPPYDNIRPRLRVVDLFCGCGGLSLGVAEAAREIGLGIDIRLAVDNEEDAVSVFQANFPHANVKLAQVERLFDGIWGTELTPAECQIKLQTGLVDVLVGGPPCQGHSDLNNYTRRNDPRNASYFLMARAARVLWPDAILIENVPTVTHDLEQVVQETVSSLESIGYSVAERVIDIAALGAPQLRRRHVVLASLRPNIDVEDIVFSLEDRCQGKHTRSIKWALSDLVKTSSQALFDSASSQSSVNVERINWLFDNDEYNLPNRMRPVCHQGNHSYNSMYGRLNWNGPAQTVTTGFASMGQGRYVHPKCRRTLTPHEAARLQMLPDFWVFDGIEHRGSLANLIGNAVPPVLATSILIRVLEELGLSADSEFPAVPKNELKKHRVIKGVGSSRKRNPNTPQASSVTAKKRMQMQPQGGTKPEVLVQEALKGLGIKYLTGIVIPNTQTRPDLLFIEEGVAVYVDGCYWHSCPEHGTRSKANAQFWSDKLASNRQRDEKANMALHKSGWLVLRFWEHDEPSVVAEDIRRVLVERRTRRQKK